MMLRPQRSTHFPYPPHCGSPVADDEACAGVRELAREEAILAGPASGAVIRAAQRVARRRDLGDSALIVAVLPEDRKSTRLNSSHLGISYAVFRLKKKKHNST